MDFPTAPSGSPGRPHSSVPNYRGVGGGAPPLSPPPPPPPPPPRGAPSKRRRDLLKSNESSPIVLSNLCPIDKYYSAADRVADRFRECCATGELDDAYMIGLRFALFSTASLPNHDYYASPDPKLAALKKKNRKDAEWVMRGLERLVEVMDREELKKVEEEEARRMEREKEERRKRERWEREARERLERVETVDGGVLVMDDMSSKLARLNTLFPRGGEENDDGGGAEEADGGDVAPLPPLPPPMAPPPSRHPSAGEEDLSLGPQNLKSDGAFPLFPKPPSYSDLFLDSLRGSSDASSVFDGDGGHVATAPTLPPLPPPAAPHAMPTENRPKQPRSKPSVQTLRLSYSRVLGRMKGEGRIEVRRLGTHQGRLGLPNDSTNGCTVISPLVVAAHVCGADGKRFRKNGRSSPSNDGVSDATINDVIDHWAPPILRVVRSKLGLNQNALIIPSDVHDYLVDEKILPQENFVGVCGGNILEMGHTSELVDMLVKGRDEGSPKQKVAAALFFREHVVSIVKTPSSRGGGSCWFDLVDSLPTVGGMASRTRSKDRESFELLLKHYACSKFSERDCDFIDKREWDDAMCDFDPRVFQAFVWSE